MKPKYRDHRELNVRVRIDLPEKKRILVINVLCPKHFVGLRILQRYGDRFIRRDSSEPFPFEDTLPFFRRPGGVYFQIPVGEYIAHTIGLNDRDRIILKENFLRNEIDIVRNPGWPCIQ